MEDRLVQEQLENGEVTARLDDARNRLRERGIDDDVRLGSHRGGDGPGGRSSESDSGDQSSFTDRSRPRKRKTPFAQIAGAGDSVAPIEVGDPAEKESSDRARTRARRSSRASDAELDQHSYQRSPKSWLPVADSSDDSTIQIR